MSAENNEDYWARLNAAMSGSLKDPDVQARIKQLAQDTDAPELVRETAESLLPPEMRSDPQQT